MMFTGVIAYHGCGLNDRSEGAYLGRQFMPALPLPQGVQGRQFINPLPEPDMLQAVGKIHIYPS